MRISKNSSRLLDTMQMNFQSFQQRDLRDLLPAPDTCVEFRDAEAHG